MIARATPGNRGRSIVRPRLARIGGGATPQPPLPTGICPFDGLTTPTIAVPIGTDCGGSMSLTQFDLPLPAYRFGGSQWVATIRASRPTRTFGARVGPAAGPLRIIAAADKPDGDACAEALSTYHQKFPSLPGEFDPQWVCRINRILHRGGGSRIEFAQRYCRGEASEQVAPGDLAGRSWAIEPSWRVGGTGYWKNHDGTSPVQHLPLPPVGDVRGRRFRIALAGVITQVPGTLGTSISLWRSDTLQVTTLRLANASGSSDASGPAVAFGPIELIYDAPATGDGLNMFTPHIQVFLAENWRGFNIVVTACSVT